MINRIRAFVYRLNPGAAGIDFSGLDTTTPWGQLSKAEVSQTLQELLTRYSGLPEDQWRNYSASSYEFSWDELSRLRDDRTYADLFQRLSDELGELHLGDIVEVMDEFVVVTGAAVWRPLIPCRLASDLYLLGRGRMPSRKPDTAPVEPEVTPEPGREADGTAEQDAAEGIAGSRWRLPDIRLQPFVAEAVRKAQPHYEPLLQSLPWAYQWRACAVVDEFFDRDLRRRLRWCRLSTRRGRLRALRLLLSLAVEREAIVTITYRQDVLGVEAAKFAELRRVLVRIWDDEVYHEVFFRTVQTGAFRPGLDRLSGRVGGRAAATLATKAAPLLRRLAAMAVTSAGRISGKLGPQAAHGLRPLAPPAYCAHNVALEITAYIAYVVMNHLLLGLSELPGSLLMDPGRLGEKVVQISGQELEHARCFRDLCVLIEGIAGEATRDRLEREGRLVQDPAVWSAARGGTGAPARYPVRESAIPITILDAAAAAQPERFATLERDLRASREPSVCIQASVDVRRPTSDPAWADVEAVTTWFAHWCSRRSIEATIYVVDNSFGKLASREALTIPAGSLAGGHPWGDAVLTTHLDQPTWLTAQGGFYSSDPDILHDVWSTWARAQLRVSVTSKPEKAGFLVENLSGLIMPVFDAWLGAGIVDVVWQEVPGLAEVATLRLLGGYPPDIGIARVRPRRRIGRVRFATRQDVMLVGPDVLALDWDAARLTLTPLLSRELYAIASLLES